MAELPDRKAPYILSLGSDLHLVVERQHWTQLDSRSPESLLTLVAAHYVFHLEYSPAVQPTMLFLQEQCLGQVEDNSKPCQSMAIFSKMLGKV